MCARRFVPGRVSMSKKVGLGERLVLQTQVGVEVERRCVELLANWRDLVNVPDDN